MHTAGLHHVTAIASDAQQNHDFYTKVLGLRLVKKTVNFDDPSTYHTYFGDYHGSPGTIITFFPWPGVRRGRGGAGNVVATAYNVPVGSSGYWTTRLVDKSVRVIADQTRFGAHVISFEDPDGMVIELIEHSSEVAPYAVAGIPSDRALRGFHSVTLLERSLDATAKVLTRKLGYVTAGAEGNRHRFIASGDAHGRIIDILVDANAARGIPGAGTVHHVAYRAKNDADQQAVQTDLQQSGLNVSPIMDRNYFHSIYFREPGGVLFEIATDAPGFDIDEPLESLGQALRLPDIYEKDRDAIEQSLPLLTSG